MKKTEGDITKFHTAGGAIVEMSMLEEGTSAKLKIHYVDEHVEIELPHAIIATRKVS